MFKCFNCEEQSKAGDSQNSVIIEKRVKIYKNVIYEGKGARKKKKEFETEGYETVREVAICKFCEDARVKLIQKASETKKELDVSKLIK